MEFSNKIEKQMYTLIESSMTTVGYGLNTGDAWPDGIFTRYGERRYIGPAGMPRGMTQITAPASDAIYGGDGSQIPEPDLGGGTFKRTKITPALVATNAVLDPHKDLRSDEPPLTPNQRVYGRRAFGKSPQYTIPRESADFVFTGDAKEQDILVKPTTPPEGNIQHGNDIALTPEPGSKALGSKSGYRQVQKGGENIIHDLDKLYIDKMLGKYDPLKEGSLPTKVKDVKKVKGAQPAPDSKKAKEFFKHHTVHSGPHITGQGAEHATYDFDDDDYEVQGGLQKRKDTQKRGYEPVESVNEKMGPKQWHQYMQYVFDTQFKTAEEKKMRKTIIKKINKGQKRKGLPIFKESVNEYDLGLTYKKGKTVKVKHKSSGKRLVIVDKPAVRKEYEKIGYFAESINEFIKLFQKTAIKKAIVIAKKMKGNMTGAVKKIEKMNRGLSDQPQVAAALRKANESINEATPKEKGNLKVMKPKFKKTMDKIYKDVASIYQNLGSVEADKLKKAYIAAINRGLNPHTNMFMKHNAQKILDTAFKNESVNEAVEPKGNMAKIAKVVTDKQYTKLSGVLIDGQSANLLMKLFNAVSDKDKEKMNKLNAKMLTTVIKKLWSRINLKLPI